MACVHDGHPVAQGQHFVQIVRDQQHCGPGITRSDLLVINKIDLAPYVGASLAVMDADTKRMRGERPYVFTNMKTGEGLQTIMNFIARRGGLPVRAPVTAE